MLVGRGLFYVSERRKLYLDCTAGHYQMLWGYNHPELCDAIAAAADAGIVWDNHSNIPQSPLKCLAKRLIQAGNAPGSADPLDTVQLGVCTGTVACAAALKVQLMVYQRTRAAKTQPVIIVLDGNYHGSDMAAQHLRGMWPGMSPGFKVVTLQPNDTPALEKAFRRYGERVAGFWAEPVMMNREAIAVEPEYLLCAQRWCRETGALLCLDEIQTGFWQPEVFAFRVMGLEPDLVVLGKGMTAGFHPLSGVLMRQRHDVLEQYDAISTNGSAALARVSGPLFAGTDPATGRADSLDQPSHRGGVPPTGRRISADRAGGTRSGIPGGVEVPGSRHGEGLSETASAGRVVDPGARLS